MQNKRDNAGCTLSRVRWVASVARVDVQLSVYAQWTSVVFQFRAGN